MARLKCLFGPGMIKLMLVLVFICNLIGWDYVYKVVTSPPVPVNQEEELQKEAAFNHFADSIIKEVEDAKASGHNFTPHEHFENLKRVELKSRELGLKSRGGNLCLQLGSIMSGIAREANTEEFITALREYRDFVDPASELRENARAGIKNLGLLGLLQWFLWLYLINMPLALILFLVWSWEEKKRFKELKPSRVACSLISYPYVLSCQLAGYFRESERNLFAEVALRQTRNQLFTYLSDEESERITRFARSNLSFSDWKKHLADLGLTPRRSLALALVVTLVFVFLPRPLKAETKKIWFGNIQNVTLERIANTILPRISIDNCKSQTGEQDFLGDRDIAANWTAITHYIVGLCAINFRAHFKRLLPPDEIFQIPRLAVHFEMAITSIQH